VSTGRHDMEARGISHQFTVSVFGVTRWTLVQHWLETDDITLNSKSVNFMK
jgi:hypothetical protein